MKILRSRIIKKIFGIALVVLFSGIFLNGYVGMNEVHAQAPITAGSAITPLGEETTATQAIDTMSIWQILNIVLKVIYLLLWPLLVVAGLALDNTLVYASIFHLDAPLWQFRNMMKNFANFALGFMVLYAIIKSIFSNSGAGSAKDEKSPLGIIKVTLIAGVLIQASWFLLAAVVDISTIATYAVGGLPLSVLKNTEIGKQKILSVNSTLDLNKFNLSFAGGEDFKVWNSVTYPGLADADQPINISPCRVDRSYVVGREYGETGYNNYEKLTGKFTGMEVCVLANSNQLVLWKEKDFFTALKSELPEPCTGCGLDSAAEYKAAMFALSTLTGWDTNTNLTNNLVYLPSGKTSFDLGNEFLSGSSARTISNLIQKSKGFVGPLVTIYSSLLNFAQLSSATVTSTSGTSGVFIIKSLVAIALFFPLLALALVLILRIGVLWLYIVASPFIILKASFKMKMGGLDEYLDIKTVMGIIFAPVVTVAALSISLIFMTALVNGFTDTTVKSSLSSSFQIEPIKAQITGNDAVMFGGITQLEFAKLPRGAAMDWFSWLMVNFFAIGLMWMIFFAALKANKIGEKFVGGSGGIQDFGENFFKTLPVLPIGPSGSGLGIGSVAKVLSGAPNTWVNNRERAQEKIASDFVFGPDSLSGIGGGTTSPTVITTTQAEKFINANATQKTIEDEVQKLAPTESIGNVLSASTAGLYEAINKLGNIDDGKKNDLIKNISLAGALSPDWYTIEATKKAKANLDDITILAADLPALQSIFNSPTPDQEMKINTYFATSGGTTYEATDKNAKKYTVTKNAATTTPLYSVTEQTTT